MIAYLVGMPEPSGALLLAADQCNPFIAAATEALPDIRIAIHAPLLLRLLERLPSRSADAVAEALVVPVC